MRVHGSVSDMSEGGVRMLRRCTVVASALVRNARMPAAETDSLACAMDCATKTDSPLGVF